MSAPLGGSKLAVVVLTYNRRQEVLRTLERQRASAWAFPLCVVDNGSTDGTAEAVSRRFPLARLVRLEQNLGAAGRNHGVRAMRARYIAFCDDDTWWAPGSLQRAVALLDAHPRLAAITARVLVGEEEREDPASRIMAASPLPNDLDIPGASAVAGMLAGASVVRRRAFLAAGGYEPELFLGGEEALLAIDLMAVGWQLAYVPELVVHHYPAGQRDADHRRQLLLRNALWCAWLRRPLASALKETLRRAAPAVREPGGTQALLAALRGLRWVLRHRRVVPAHVESQLRLLEKAAA